MSHSHPLRAHLLTTARGSRGILLSACNQSVNFSLEILSLYWNSLSFRGGSIASLPRNCKRRVAGSDSDGRAGYRRSGGGEGTGDSLRHARRQEYSRRGSRERRSGLLMRAIDTEEYREG